MILNAFYALNNIVLIAHPVKYAHSINNVLWQTKIIRLILKVLNALNVKYNTVLIVINKIFVNNAK